MNLDPCRDALQRVAREIGIDPGQHPDRIATKIIQHFYRQKTASDALEALLQARNPIKEGASK